jgi:DNA mismatch repair protein MutH
MADPGWPDEAALLARARGLAGRLVASLGEVSGRHKGGVGERVEVALGLVPSSAPEPDVPALGIEVKTVPVAEGRVLESTWVCSASPASIQEETWATSRVRKKLTRVLFVPVEGGKVPHDKRRVGTAFLWTPDDDEEAVLRADWEDLADLVAHGLGFAITARRGRALQLRPKAKNASVRRAALDVEGERYVAAPQGFYLRRGFVQAIVDRLFGPTAS